MLRFTDSEIAQSRPYRRTGISMLVLMVFTLLVSGSLLA